MKTFGSFHWFHSKSAQVCIDFIRSLQKFISFKNRSSLIWVIIWQNSAELWPYFWLSLCWWVEILVSVQHVLGDALISSEPCRWVYHCKIQMKFDIDNYLPNFGQVIALSRLHFLLLCRYCFPLNNFCRDAFISLEVCKRIYHCKMQIKLDTGNRPQTFGRVMTFLCKIQGKDIVSP